MMNLIVAMGANESKRFQKSKMAGGVKRGRGAKGHGIGEDAFEFCKCKVLGILHQS